MYYRTKTKPRTRSHCAHFMKHSEYNFFAGDCGSTHGYLDASIH